MKSIMVGPISLESEHCIPNFIPFWILLLTSAPNALFVELRALNSAFPAAHFTACHILFNLVFRISYHCMNIFFSGICKNCLHGKEMRVVEMRLVGITLTERL